MLIFDKPGPDNTAQTLELVVNTMQKRDLHQVVVASNTGETARQLLHLIREKRITAARVVVVTHVQGFAVPGENEMSLETRQSLSESGCQVITAAHALSGGERSLSQKYHGLGPVEISAQTLRILGPGVKVALEISLMAMDAGALTHSLPVMAIGGTGRGADTAVILTSETSARFLDSRIHEILCKPY